MALFPFAIGPVTGAISRFTSPRAPPVPGSELYYAVFEAFRKQGIEIPFPQRDLHLRSVSASVRISHDG